MTNVLQLKPPIRNLTMRIVTLYDDGAVFELSSGFRVFIRKEDKEEFLKCSGDTVGDFILDRAQHYLVTVGGKC